MPCLTFYSWSRASSLSPEKIRGVFSKRCNRGSLHWGNARHNLPWLGRVKVTFTSSWPCKHCLQIHPKLHNNHPGMRRRWESRQWGGHREGQNLNVIYLHLPKWEHRLNMLKTENSRNRSRSMVLRVCEAGGGAVKTTDEFKVTPWSGTRAGKKAGRAGGNCSVREIS